MDNFIKGSGGVIFIDDAGVWKPIACLTSNSLSSALSVIETRTKCDPDVTVKSSGAFSYSLSAEGNYIDTTSVGGDTAKASHDWLLEKQMAKTDVTWRMSTGLADQEFYYGTAVITDLDLTFDGSGDDFANFSATFDGNGNILLVDPLLP